MPITNLKLPDIPSPCDECLVVPICRSKMFKKLVNDCTTVNKFLYQGMKPMLGYYTSWGLDNHPSITHRHASVLKALKPIYWYMYIYNDNEVIIMIAGDFAYYHDNAGKVIRVNDAENPRIEYTPRMRAQPMERRINDA